MWAYRTGIALVALVMEIGRFLLLLLTTKGISIGNPPLSNGMALPTIHMAPPLFPLLKMVPETLNGIEIILSGRVRSRYRSVMRGGEVGGRNSCTRKYSRST